MSKKTALAMLLGILGCGTDSGEEADPIGDTLRADAVAYWKMDETSGTRADATGNGNDITVFGDSVVSAAGKIGNGANLIAAGGSLENANISTFNMGGRSFSFAGWVKPTILTTGYVFSKGDTNDATEWSLQIDGDSKMRFGNMGDDYSDLSVVAESHGVLTLDVFVFVVAFTDLTNNLIGVQVNNGTVDTLAFTPDNLNGNTPFAFNGRWSSLGGQYAQECDAVADEFLLLYRTLTSDEKTYLYNAGAGRTLFP